MYNLKRFLALVLALSMMLTVVPFGAFATETEEQTSEPTESVTEAPGSDVAAIADDGTAATSLTLGAKPADGTVTGQPFDTTVSKNYRIPGLVNHNGTLIASADARWDNEKDGGGNDTVVSRSEDGETWNYTFAGYLGDNGNVWNNTSSTLIDPVIISDGSTLYLLVDLFPAGYSLSTGNTAHDFSDTAIGFDTNGNLLLSKDNRSSYGYYLKDGKIYATDGTEQTDYTVDPWFNLYQNNTYVSNLFYSDSLFQVRATSYICLLTSTDGGETWNNNGLLNVKPSGVAWMVLGPGSGLALEGGDIAFTAYDGSKIYLIWGNAVNGWNCVSTNAAKNESSIVELSDGTIRAFVKNDSNVITYVDFTKNGDSYTAGSAMPTGVSNTGWCMISSMMYSKQIDGKDVILVCCPTGNGIRENGKIHVFTLDESNNMTLLKSYEINGSGEFFAYSDMVEMNDGTIALLYEDGCLSYTSNGVTYDNGVGYSHIEYRKVDPVEDMDLSFDAALEQEGVKVQLSASAGVNHMHVETATVDSITTAYSAYNVVLCTDKEASCTAGLNCASTYTGSATVTIPLTEALKNAADVKGFVVNADGTINSVYNVEKTDDSVTFVAPHFSVVGIAEVTADESTYTSVEDITVYVGETKEISLTEDAGTGSQNGTVADVTWAGSTITSAVVKAIAGLADDANYEDSTTHLDNCLYTFQKNTDGTYTISGQTSDGTPVYLYHLTNGAGCPNSATEHSVSITTETDGFRFHSTDGNGYESYLYFWQDGKNYFDRVSSGDSLSQCLFQLYRPVKDGETASDSVPGYIKVSVTEELDGGQYLIVASYDEPTYVLHPSTSTSVKYDHVAKITDETEETTTTTSATTITITGKAAGTTSVVIGSTKYNITVQTDARNITLYEGLSQTVTIEGTSYTDADVTVRPDASIATLDNVESTTTEGGKELVEITDLNDLVEGKQYLLYNIREGGLLTAEPITDDYWDNKSYTGLKVEGAASVDSTELWEIASSGNGFTIARGDNYLTFGDKSAGTTDTETVLTLDYTTGSGWRIIYNNLYLTDLWGTNMNGVYGFNDNNASTATDGGNYWKIYEVAETAPVSTTEVTFTGVKEGTTTATIGRVTYNITVTKDVRDIVLYAGKSKTVTINGVGYSMDDVKASPVSTYATLDSVTSTGAQLVPVTEIESGKHYLIVNKQTGEVLTNTAVSAAGNWENKSGLETTGNASTDSTELWEITTSGNGYAIVQDGKYLTVSGYYAVMSDTETALTLTYSGDAWTIMDNTTWASLTDHTQANYYLSDNVGNGYDEAALGTSALDEYCYWTIYEIDPAGSTNVTFTGVSAGTTTATVGHVTYNITVVDAPKAGDIPGFNNIVGEETYTAGNSSYDMAGKVIKSLRITAGAEFNLSVDATEYDEIIWSTDNEAAATVDDRGVVTAVAEGTAHITATVVKDGVEESISIEVTVVPSLVENYSDDEIAAVFYYIEQVDNTDPYYTMFVSTASDSGPVDNHRLVKVTEGEVLWFERPIESAFALIWTADPWEEHALTLMTSTGTLSHYYPLKDSDGNLATSTVTDPTDTNPGDYYKGSISYNNILGFCSGWKEGLDAVLEESILLGKGTWDSYGCDGAMSYSRRTNDNTPGLVTSMTFISDPMPNIKKSVNGILPVTRLQKDFRPYEDGMLASVGEYVYFQIDITVKRPTVWVKDADGNDTTTGAIDYSNAILTDTALSVVDEAGNYESGAYFYTKEDDAADGGTLDGVVTEGNRVTRKDITAALNANWADGEETRTLSYYLVYEIVKDDIPKFSITNTANLAWNYQSVYSTGSMNGAADANASITVVGSAMDNVVIDFGQRIEYTGLTQEHLKYVHTGTYNTTYGVVEVIGIDEQQEDASGTYYNSYKVIYTPTSILRGPDAIQLMGSYTDQDDTNSIPNDTKIEKAINGFVVYPATSVYYEEGFMFDYENDDAESKTQWVTTDSQKATACQTFEKLSETTKDANGTVTYVSDKQNAYGYDPIYADNTVAASSVSSSVVGAATSFQFTGTGFELYANSTTGTGRVAVSVYNADGTLEAMYVVNTVAANGTTDATEGQNIDLNSLPIVSVKDMAHGTYTVKLTKVVNDSKPVYIDGVRIINTVADSSIFNIDLEDNPEFYQLRDYVLNAIDVGNVSDSMYAQLGEDPSITQIANQIYAGISTDTEAPYAVVLAGGQYDTNVQDLLDNGPKNELYLHQNETLVFNVKTSRAMQIGLKAPAGETSYTITGAANDGISGTLKTSTDMFYALGNTIGAETTYTITITNNGSNILSVTDLKICDDPNAAFVPLTVEDIKATLVTMGYGVAENTTTGESFETVSAALAAAKDGETVKLLADCTETNLMVTAGVTLDLNGFDLTASYVVAFDSAHIVDNAGGGFLAIGTKNLVLDEDNAMIAVYSGEGYVFTKAGFAIRQNGSYTGEGIKIDAMAYPVDMDVVEMLKNGGADNNIEIIIRLTWDTDQGTGSQDFKFNDDVVSSVYSSNNGSWNGYGKMFSMVVTGFQNIENLKANIIVVSGTNAEYVSSKTVDIT